MPITGFNASDAAPSALPIPKPVRPDMMPSLRLPVAAVVANPEPIAPAIAELNPAPPTNPPSVDPASNEEPNMLPSKGARKGKNASGWPVIGLVVNFPVGERAAIP